MPPDPRRLLRALARQGLDVTREGPTYRVRLAGRPDLPAAEVLLPDDLRLEAKAVAQLAALTAVRHPDGGRVTRCCATPDFHPGDAGIAIGSIVEAEGLVIPQAVGSDINCGMRLHVTDLTVDRFEAGRDALIERLRGDFLLGTRDVVLAARAMRAVFAGGTPEWAEAVADEPHGFLQKADLDQILDEALSRTWGQGSLDGDPALAPEVLLPTDGVVRDDGLGTIGRGNHFVEWQVVHEIRDAALARSWGVRRGQVAFMIHSGSRKVGKVIGRRWWEEARAAWPDGVRYPDSRIFPLADGDPRRDAYLRAERTAANYGFVNRAILAELCRTRLREVFGPISAPLVWDLPHNLSTLEEGPDGVRRWVCRKGACPAHAGEPVIIPGSMGTKSFLLVGRGSHRFLRSASHGAGRAASRGAMGRSVRDAAHADALGLSKVDCVTLREERRVEEAPAAYKPIEPVILAQVEAGMVDVVAELRPLVTFKA